MAKRTGKARKKRSGPSKGQLKRQQMAEKLEAEMRLKAVVEAALHTDDGSVKNVLDGTLPLFHELKAEDADLEITFSSPDDTSEEDKQWMLRLIRDNLKEQYIEAGWGWSDGEKYKELTDGEARYLLVRDRKQDNKLVAFTHFRFLLEGRHPVLYVFEIQLTEEMRRKGLGTRLMLAMEAIAKKEQMKWIMLTVFKSNEAGMAFYQKLKYSPDEVSLTRRGQDVSYEILSKCVCKETREKGERRHGFAQAAVAAAEPAAAGGGADEAAAEE